MKFQYQFIFNYDDDDDDRDDDTVLELLCLQQLWSVTAALSVETEVIKLNIKCEFE